MCYRINCGFFTCVPSLNDPYPCVFHTDQYSCRYQGTFPARIGTATELPSDAALTEPDLSHAYSCTYASALRPVIWQLSEVEVRLNVEARPAEPGSGVDALILADLGTSIDDFRSLGVFLGGFDGEWLFSVGGELLENRSLWRDGKEALRDVGRLMQPGVASQGLYWMSQHILFNPVTRRLDIRAEWYCDDRNDENP